MKRLLPLLLALLLLTACGGPGVETTQTTAPQTPPPETTQTTLPPAVTYYDPESAMEEKTAGAVRAYPLGSDNCSGMELTGEELVLFLNGETSTQLIQLTGELLTETVTAEVQNSIFPGEPDVRVNDRGVGYYDREANAVVFLDRRFQEMSRIEVPDVVQGTPVLTRDWSTIYYCTDNAIRGLNLETGIPRLVRGEYDCEWQSLNQLHCNDSVLSYTLSQGGEVQTCYITADTGELLYDGDQLLSLHAESGWYFGTYMDSFVPEYIYGKDAMDGTHTLIPAERDIQTFPMLELGGVVTARWGETDTLLDYYDLTTGKRTASVLLEGVTGISDYALDGAQQQIWLLNYDPQTAEQTIYRWEPLRSPVEDEKSYSVDRSTGMDVALLSCRAEAERIGQAYGVELLLGDAVLEVQPVDYELVPEYSAAALQRGLELLEEALAVYPEGFLAELGSMTERGTLVIGLLRDAAGLAEYGGLPDVNGVQYWLEDGNAYLAVVLSETAGQDLHHELFHVIDSYVLSACTAYDDWDELNPRGFEYDYDYLANQSRDGSGYLEEGSRAFIDTYSMSFPGEDRARIMEYALLAEGAAYFTSDTMQEKLEQLCAGIRRAFGLEEHPEALPWEQYLLSESE